MKPTIEYDIGSEVACSDGVCGDLRRIVVDPVAVAITHLVVAPKHPAGMGHLVPIDLVTSVAEEIQLRCTTAEFEALEDAEEIHFLPGAGGGWDYHQEHMLSMPYYGLATPRMGSLMMGGMNGLGANGRGAMGAGTEPQSITRDRVPVGEVEVRRGDHVYATDGPTGRVQGLVIDPSDHHVTHVLLQEGHLWGQKRITIPIGAVTGVEHGVRLSLAKNAVRDLPSVDLDDPE